MFQPSKISGIVFVLGLSGLAGRVQADGVKNEDLLSAIQAESTAIQDKVATESTGIKTEGGAQHTLTQDKIAAAQATATDQHDLIRQDIAEVKTLILGLGPSAPTPLCGAGTDEQRFVVSQDNTEACDNTTGLYWELSESSGGTLTHPDAVSHCLSLDLGNGHSYRLPEVKDLISLVDYRVPSFGSPPVGSGLPIGFLFATIHPFIDVVAATYWSASLNTANYSEAYFVTFNTGEVFLADALIDRHTWCVR